MGEREITEEELFAQINQLRSLVQFDKPHLQNRSDINQLNRVIEAQGEKLEELDEKVNELEEKLESMEKAEF